MLNSRATIVAGAALASPVVERPAISVQIAVQEELAVAAQVEDPVTGLPGRGDLLGGVRFAGVPFGRGAGGQDRRVFGGEGIGQASLGSKQRYKTL